MGSPNDPYQIGHREALLGTAAAGMGFAQAATAFPLRLLPLLAPTLLVQAGTPVSAIGYFSSLAMGGAMLGSLATGALCARFGSRRSLQLAMAIATAAALLHGITTWVAFVVASLLAGVADGIALGAGNSLLQLAASPTKHQRLFAVKMVGAPVGGLAASLLLPRAALESSTWRVPIIAAAVTLTVGLLLVASRTRWPEEPARSADTHGAARAAGTGLATLTGLSHLRRIAALGFLLAFSQGVWYAYFIGFLVIDGGVTLVTAGTLMSVALAAGILTRVAFGFVAYRLARPERLLGVVCIASAVPWFVLSSFDRQDEIWTGALMAAAFGATLGGWVGVQQAEISRIAPPGQADQLGGAAAFLMFLALTLSGACFALLIEASGDSRSGFQVLGAAAILFGGVSLFRPSVAAAVRSEEKSSKTTGMQ